jgi:hypothetical protein
MMEQVPEKKSQAHYNAQSPTPAEQIALFGQLVSVEIAEVFESTIKF